MVLVDPGLAVDRVDSGDGPGDGRLGLSHLRDRGSLGFGEL
jgi:hypothetical protein